MASSSSRKEKKEAKKRLLNLQDEVEGLERRLRQQTEQTNQSIDQLSIDCKSNCAKVWEEFDSFVENARLKAGELCDDMKRKANRQQSEWRRSVQVKENLLEEAEEWLNDLRHLSMAGNNDDFRRLQTEGSELTSRLRESFTLLDECQFVVTFPDWCRRSLNDLQGEVVDFAVKTCPPRDLELRTQCHLQGSNLEIRSIVSSDEDGHVFVVDVGDNSIKEFAESGEFIGQSPCWEGGERFFPRDICCLSKDDFVISGCLWSVMRGGLLFLTRQKCPPFLKREKLIDTKEKPFHSLFQMDDKIFVCVWDLEEIVCFSKEGQKIKTIKIEGWPESAHRPYPPLLRADPTTGNLWLTGRRNSEIFVLSQNGQILQKLDTEEEIIDLRGDGYGHFYFCNKKGIFSILPEKIQHTFPQRTGAWPTIFVSSRKLFVTFRKNKIDLMRIFQIY